ncbi:MAG: ABC transporter substrate-binding protein [Deltaproteobacteria bacterium]|nr:ABC transporter substrate-binding protein [Deltaproteobacteria bacterium]
MQFKKYYLATVLSVIFLLTLCPMSFAANPPGFDDKEIRVAQWGPQTGPAAPWGSVARGTDILFKMVNDEGGIAGRKVKYFVRDDQYNPVQTKTVVKELVERQGIFAFVGGVGAANGMSVIDYLEENKIIWVGPSTAVKEYVFPARKYVFCLYPLYEDEASILMKFAIEKLKAKKIALFYQNDIYGKNGLDGCNQRLAKHNMKLALEIPVEPGEKDLGSQILKLKNANPDVVFLWVNPTIATIAVKTAAALNFKPQWISSNTLSDYPLMNKITGGLWEGVITGNFGEAPDSKLPLYLKYLEVKKKHAPEERLGTFYTAGIMYAEPLVYALKKVGKNLSTDAVLKELNSIKDFQGIGPRITWTEKQHQGTDSIIIQKCGPNSSYILLQGWAANDLAHWKK